MSTVCDAWVGRGGLGVVEKAAGRPGRGRIRRSTWRLSINETRTGAEERDEAGVLGLYYRYLSCLVV